MHFRVARPGRPEVHVEGEPRRCCRAPEPRRRSWWIDFGAVDQIAIIGCGGSSKTHLARRLSAALVIPVTHLDALHYDSDWNRIPADRSAALQRELAAQPRWVADGNYAATLPIRLAAADTVIFLDLPAWACLWGSLQRRLRHGAGQHAPTGVYDRITWDFLRYVLGYRRSMRPSILRLLAQDAGRADLVVLRSRRATRRFLRKLLDAEHGLVPMDKTAGSA
jgi:adenylate kinase family enzyme